MLRLTGHIEDAIVEKLFNEGNFWGIEAQIDLKECNKEFIMSENGVHDFIIQLCEDVIHMERFGSPFIINFGNDPKVSGFSVTQLIETSLVSGHFVNLTGDVFLNIFSCKIFGPIQASKFASDWFWPKNVDVNVVLRGGSEDN